jgi:hypothetical protein
MTDYEQESHIEFALYQALDAAGDRCEQYGGDIRELQKIRDTAPTSMETVHKIMALYRRPWWQRMFG